jgi:hypothetical protein
MTICVSVRTAEGLVLAADSATILQGDVDVGGAKSLQILQTFNYATKVAQVGDLPMGVMTWGIGTINSRSIQSLVMEFEFDYKVRGKFSVRTVADALLRFISARYRTAFPSPTQLQTLGLFVGGYSDGEFFSEQMSCELPADTTWTPIRSRTADGTQDFGANWFGATDALVRLIRGFDPTSLDKLVESGAPIEAVQAWVDSGAAALPIVFDGMPLQDAIDFAEWATMVVIGRWRFGLGTALVGGDVDIAVIRPRSFNWAQRKRWSIKDEGHDGRRQPMAPSRERDGDSRVPSDGSAGELAADEQPPPPTAARRPATRTKASRRRR